MIVIVGANWEKLAAYRKNELWSLMVESIDDFFLFKN